VSADGSFVMIEDAFEDGATRRTPAIHIIQSWYEEFRDREQN